MVGLPTRRYTTLRLAGTAKAVHPPALSLAALTRKACITDRAARIRKPVATVSELGNFYHGIHVIRGIGVPLAARTGKLSSPVISYLCAGRHGQSHYTFLAIGHAGCSPGTASYG